MTRTDALRIATLALAIGAIAVLVFHRNEESAAPDVEAVRTAPVVEAPPPGLAPAARVDGDGGASRSRAPRERTEPEALPKTDAARERVASLHAAAADAQAALAAVSRAIEALHDEDEAVRAAAAQVLAAAGRPAVEPLIAAVREDIAAHASEWTTFPSAASVAFDGLVEAGADLVARALAEPQVEFWAATTLGRAASLRKDLHLALPVLQELLRGENERARQWAAQAVPAAGPGTDRVVPDLARCLLSTNVQTRLEAVQALRRIGPPAAGALSDLRALSTDPNATVRRFAVEAIGSIEAR